MVTNCLCNRGMLLLKRVLHTGVTFIVMRGLKRPVRGDFKKHRIIENTQVQLELGLVGWLLQGTVESVPYPGSRRDTVFWFMFTL